MKTILTLLICISFFNAKSQFFDYSRIQKVNTNILNEFKEKKYKKAQKIKRLKIDDIFAMSEDTLIIKAQQDIYSYIISTNELVEITNSDKMNELKQKIIDLYIDIPSKEDSFTKKEAKEKAKEVGKQAAKGILAILTNTNIDVSQKNIMIMNPEYQDSVKCYFAYYKYTETMHNKANNSNIREKSYCSVNIYYFMDSLNATFEINESWLSTDNLAKKALFSPQVAFKSSYNSEYLLFDNYLFDLKSNTRYNLFTINHRETYVLFDYRCRNIIVFTDNPFRKEIMVDVIPIKEEWVKKLTERTDQEKFLAEKKRLAAHVNSTRPTGKNNNQSNGENIIHDTGENIPGFVDNRNNRRYGYIEIGMQTWMTENMNIGEMITGKEKQKDDGKIEKYCYNNNERYCDKYGGLYQWDEAMQYNAENARGICPEGWHIPTTEEWNILINYLGGKKQAGSKMKKEEESLWQVYQQNSNSSGFSAVPAGYRSKAGGGFVRLNVATYMRTSSNGAPVYIHTKEDYAIFGSGDKKAGFSVRCIKD